MVFADAPNTVDWITLVFTGVTAVGAIILGILEIRDRRDAARDQVATTYYSQRKAHFDTLTDAVNALQTTFNALTDQASKDGQDKAEEAIKEFTRRAQSVEAYVPSPVATHAAKLAFDAVEVLNTPPIGPPSLARLDEDGNKIRRAIAEAVRLD